MVSCFRYLNPACIAATRHSRNTSVRQKNEVMCMMFRRRKATRLWLPLVVGNYNQLVQYTTTLVIISMLSAVFFRKSRNFMVPAINLFNANLLVVMMMRYYHMGKQHQTCKKQENRSEVFTL